MEKYRIGTTRDGFTVFYQYDIMDRCRTGKIIPYDPHTGHRIKEGSAPEAMWVHSRLKAMYQLPDGWTLSQCLFGEHLLPRYPDLPVAMVEAEETTVICSAVFPGFLWLATGGLSQFNDRVKVLLGRKVIAIPELGAYDLWRKKAQEYPCWTSLCPITWRRTIQLSCGRWGPIWRIILNTSIPAATSGLKISSSDARAPLKGDTYCTR